MKEQEVIKRLNFHKEYARLSSNRVVISETDLETVLNMLKEKDREIERLRYIKKSFDYVVQKETEKKDKQIDLMAEFIEKVTVDLKVAFGENMLWNRDEIKQYFERKSEE